MTALTKSDHTGNVLLKVDHAAPQRGQELFSVIHDPAIPGQLVFTDGHPYVPRRGDKGRFIGGAHLRPQHGEALRVKFVAHVMQIDWPQFRALVAEEVKVSIEQARKRIHDDHLRAAESLLLEAARMLDGSAPQDLTATYGGAIVGLRLNVHGIWAAQLKDYNNSIRDVKWPSFNDVRPRFEEVLNRSGVLRTLKVLGASLRVSAALSQLPDDTNYRKHKREYDEICEALIGPLIDRAKQIDGQIKYDAEYDYHFARSGWEHDKSQRHFMALQQTLAVEVERVIAMIQACTSWSDASTVITNNSLADQLIAAPVYGITRF